MSKIYFFYNQPFQEQSRTRTYNQEQEAFVTEKRVNIKKQRTCKDYQVFQKLIFDYVFEFKETNKLLNNKYSGFRLHDSYINKLCF